ncbi:hypothetical protein K0M31_004428 [Melipona bicolor]|uniref:Uncharacterized protein n=1 Tax=Melipona bicolor TaxID=60889 RepID=A0AA40FXE2_9HYME|nr:hypothetical protein K0M31_004428 [Melipona bicolor]
MVTHHLVAALTTVNSNIPPLDGNSINVYKSINLLSLTKNGIITDERSQPINYLSYKTAILSSIIFTGRNDCHSWADRRFYGDRAFPHVLCSDGSLNTDAYLSILGEVPGKGSLAKLVYGPPILLQRLLFATWKVHNSLKLVRASIEFPIAGIIGSENAENAEW